MKLELQAVRDGQMSFDAFVRATDREWGKLAASMYRKYKLPDGVEMIDVKQELVLSAWRASASWLETNGQQGGMSLEGYVIWKALSDAGRWMHQQRNSLRRGDKTPSRFPTNWTAFTRKSESGDNHGTMEMDLMLPADAEAEELTIGMQQLAIVISELEDESHRVAMAAWYLTGSVEGAVQYLESSAKLRSALNIWTEGSAQRLVRKAIATSLKMAQQMAA